MGHDLCFFLGANSREGFYSLYDDFVYPDKGDFLWLLKGGPGCGKSSFMGAIGNAAREAGLETEYIRCSGDPDSLDGVYIPEKHLAYVDATAPHRMDARLPAAGDAYLDLGAFYDLNAMRCEREMLADMNRRYSAIYKRVYALLSAAGNMDAGIIGGLVTDAEKEQARRRAQGTAEREFGRAVRLGGGREKQRFISAISCGGCIRLQDTVTTLCSRVYALDDEYGLADTYLRTLSDAAWARGIDAVICRDPLNPNRLEALLLPELSLGFAASRPRFGEAPGCTRNVRLDALVPKARVQQYRRKIRATAKLKNALLDEAVTELIEAKALHDEIEAVYNPHVDFDGIYELCNRHIKMMLEK
ncbi:MAG: hypothetical protein ACOX81_07700 [Candidatus Heteroscillospira sp.]|jgi:hypothetical protein